MTRKEFIKLLKRKLKKSPIKDKDERIRFYTEMLDDLIEDGLSEDEAIRKILASLDPSDIADEEEFTEHTGKNSKRTALTVLLILGSPVWASLLIAAAAVLFSLFVTVWSLIGAAWSVFAAFAISGPVSILVGIFTAFINPAVGIGLFCAGLVVSGLAIFSLVVSLAATKGCIRLTNLCAERLRSRFTKKEVR